MGETIYKAAIEGNIKSLLKLIQEDPLIVARPTSITTIHLETPLHIAAMLGHESFVEELLKRKPELAREVNSSRSTALHLASAKGHVGIAKALLSVDPDTCFVCDSDGRNPLHVAAMMGRIDVLKEMLLKRPDAAPAVMKHSGNVLHLCVEYCQFEALQIIVENVDLQDLLNSKDRNGNTILHLAVAHKQVETTEFLLCVPGMDFSAENLSGMTAMDILIERRMDARDLEIEESLKRAGATAGKRNISPFHQNKDNHDGLCSCKSTKKQPKSKEDWIERKRNTLMVVASVVATMAFQAAVNPPKDVWQGTRTNSTQTLNDVNNFKNTTSDGGLQGNLANSKIFFVCNTISFIASLSVILLLMSGLPLKSRCFVFFLLFITWIGITDLALAYGVTVALQIPSEEVQLITTVGSMVIAWNCLVTILLLVHTIRFLRRMVRKLWKMIKLLPKYLEMIKFLPKYLSGGRGSSGSARRGNNSRVYLV